MGSAHCGAATSGDHAVIPSWYTAPSTVLGLDGRPRPLIAEQQPAEVNVGADGFTR